MNARILAALLLLAATGCIDNNASIRINAACFPPTPNDNGTCSYPAKCDSVMLDNLWVNARYGPTFGTLLWPFQIDNQRPQNGNGDGALNTATAYVTGYRIAYSSPAVSLPEAKFDYSTQTVEAKSSTVLIVPVVTPEVAAVLAALGANAVALIQAEIRATGHYADGSTFETGPFSVVVELDNAAGAGASCTDPIQTVMGACPQLGQTSIPLCK